MNQSVPVPSASSSATARKITSRSSATFSRLEHHHHDQLRQAFVFHVLRAASPEVAVSISPLNGGTRQCAASLVTTSIWLSRISGRFASVVVCGIRAHRSPRPARIRRRDSQFLPGRGSSFRTPPHRISLPGGLVVSMRRYSCIHVTAKSEYCCMWSAGIREEPEDSSLQINPTSTNVSLNMAAHRRTRHRPNPHPVSAIRSQKASPRGPLFARSFWCQVCQNYPAKPVPPIFPTQTVLQCL